MNKLKYLLSAIILSTAALITGVSISFAWLYNIAADIRPDITGEILASYFHTGTGTKENPYVITKPVHLYNLAQLYELKEGFAEENNYFQLGYDLDNDGDLEVYNYDDNGALQNGYSTQLNMNYYSEFIPIGSERNPFGGAFNGSNLTINNLNISGKGISDIGVFGYVNEKAKIKDLYIDNLEINTTGSVANAHSEHNNAYVGYIAGHIDDANCFSNTYVNNCEIKGRSVLTKNDWGYFGKCENAASIEAFIHKASASQGDDWGGSIDFKAFNQRIHDIFNTQNATYGATYYGYYQTDEMKLSFGRGGGSAETYLKQDQNNIQTYYLLQGDGDHYYSNSSSTKLNMPGTVMPLLANNDFSADERNTGYIIGDTRPNSNGKLLFDSSVRSSSYTLSHIGNSLSDTQITEGEAYNGSGNGANVRYSENSTEILTNSTASYSQNNFVLVKDTYNANHTVNNSFLAQYTKNDNTTPEKLALEKYSAARESLRTILDGSTLVHGLHFMDKDIAYNNTTSLPTAKLNGQTYHNYTFPKSCIDFHLKEDGKINFFGGSYYNASSVSHADCFFSLSVIERNENNLTNNSIKKISYIYKNTAYDKTNPDSQKYIYRYSDNSYSGSQSNIGELVFDMGYLSETPPVQNAIYYFEIPVNKGEYALHGVSGHDAGGYLMYLDIGASGVDNEEGLVDDFKSVEYRTAQDTAESSILLITYEQQADQTVSLIVAYIEAEKRYNITYSGTLTKITVTILNADYIVYYNGSLLEQAIKSHTFS